MLNRNPKAGFGELSPFSPLEGNKMKKRKMGGAPPPPLPPDEQKSKPPSRKQKQKAPPPADAAAEVQVARPPATSKQIFEGMPLLSVADAKEQLLKARLVEESALKAVLPENWQSLKYPTRAAIAGFFDNKRSEDRTGEEVHHFLSHFLCEAGPAALRAAYDSCWDCKRVTIRLEVDGTTRETREKGTINYSGKWLARHLSAWFSNVDIDPDEYPRFNFLPIMPNLVPTGKNMPKDQKNLKPSERDAIIAAADIIRYIDAMPQGIEVDAIVCGDGAETAGCATVIAIVREWVKKHRPDLIFTSWHQRCEQHQITLAAQDSSKVFHAMEGIDRAKWEKVVYLQQLQKRHEGAHIRPQVSQFAQKATVRNEQLRDDLIADWQEFLADMDAEESTRDAFKGCAPRMKKQQGRKGGHSFTMQMKLGEKATAKQGSYVVCC
eukprot:g4322.t1